MEKLILTRNQLKNIILQDDATPYGGIAFENETAAEFCDACFNDNVQSNWYKYNKINLAELNPALIECGIKPLAEDKIKN